MAVQLRAAGHEVYDFTDPVCRKTPEIPLERYPDQFDPVRHVYREYLEAVPEWCQAVEANREAIQGCTAIILILPCGLDAHADAFYGLGLGRYLIVCGQPLPGERTPTHMWADKIVDRDYDAIKALTQLQKEKS